MIQLVFFVLSVISSDTTAQTFILSMALILLVHFLLCLVQRLNLVTFSFSLALYLKIRCIVNYYPPMLRVGRALQCQVKKAFKM